MRKILVIEIARNSDGEVGTQGQDRTERCNSYAWNGAEPVEERQIRIAHDVGLLSDRIVILVHRSRVEDDAAGEHVLLREAERNLTQGVNGAEKKAGADEEDESKRKLGYD